MNKKQKRPLPRVGFISQWFPPEPVIVPTSIYDTLSSSYEVTALTGQPNYPLGVVQRGYSALSFGNNNEGGRRIRRTPLFPSHSKSAAGRILNYLSWAVSATLFGGKALYKQDLNFVYASPVLAALPAMAARITMRVPYVLNVQDLWPDSVFATGFLETGVIRGIAETILSAFANAAYQLASAVVVVSPGMADVLESRGVNRKKIHLVYNWTDESIFRPRQSREAVASSCIPTRAQGLRVLTYAGNLGSAQNLHQVVEALARVQDELPAVHLRLIGDGVEAESLKSLVARLGLNDRVHFEGRIPLADVPAQLQAADACLVSLGKSPLFAHTMPSKVQSILACGSPIFVVGTGDVAALAMQDGAGWHAEPGDLSSIAEALRRFARAETSTQGLTARKVYEREMSRDVGSAKLLSIVELARKRPKEAH